MNEPSPVRRLTTILAIDVVGFSTMSARNEEHALGLLNARLAIAETYIKQHRGRVFKMTGDGLLAEFASPVESVRAAVEIQEAMRTTNALAAEGDRLSLRIGANLGDVVENGDDLMGDAVNVAVRLESIAPVGGICVSANVYEQIVGKLTLGAEDMGEQQVKNIPRPIHAYRLTAEGAPPAAPAPVPPRPASRRKALAALGVAALLVVAGAVVAGSWLLVGTSVPPVEIAAPASVAATPSPPAAATPAAARFFVAADVPFLPDRARRELEAYAAADGVKALAINIRGAFSFASRRVDEPTARKIALDQCNSVVQKTMASAREVDRCAIYAIGDKVVWSFRPPALPPPPYVPNARPTPAIPLDAAAVPLIGDAARTGVTERYMKADRNRAYAIGRNKIDAWSTGASDAEAIRRALQSCGHLAGRPCVIYAVGDQVVVRVPRTYRLVDVFTPQDLPDLEPAQREAVERYLVADDWRAIAVGRNGRIGIATVRANEEAAVEAALRECARVGGTECAVSAVGPFLVTRN